MRAVRMLFAALVAALSLVVLVPSASYACSCQIGSLQEYVDRADVVLQGTVVHRAPPPQRPVMSSGDPATYTVTVDRVLKGGARATTRVLSADQGASCGLERIRIGRRYLVFANQTNGRLWASLCGGTAPATPSFVAKVQALTGRPVARTPVDQPPMPDDTRDQGRLHGLVGWLTGERLALGVAGASGLVLLGAAVALVVRANR